MLGSGYLRLGSYTICKAHYTSAAVPCSPVLIPTHLVVASYDLKQKERRGCQTEESARTNAHLGGVSLGALIERLRQARDSLRRHADWLVRRSAVVSVCSLSGLVERAAFVRERVVVVRGVEVEMRLALEMK